MGNTRPRETLTPLSGTITTDEPVEVAVGDVEYLKISCESGSPGSLVFAGENSDIADGDTLVAGSDTGWLDVQERIIWLKRSGGNAVWKIRRIGYTVGS